MGYRLAADLILILHASFIAFVIVALLLTLLGWWRNWQWVRNRWFRGLHLLCIAYVVLEAWLGVVCPLTSWESALRLRGGQEPYSGDGFIADWLHRLVFFDAKPWVFTLSYTCFGLLVAATFFLAPPRWRARPKDHPDAVSQDGVPTDLSSRPV